MCWFSLVGGAVNKGIGWTAKACGASDEERKALEAGLNIAVGTVGAFVDPLGGGILITRGVIQAARADNPVTDAAGFAMDVVNTKYHDKAVEAAAHAADNLLNFLG